MKNFALFTIVCLIMTSCNNRPAGPSPAEIELQQMKQEKARTETKAVIDSNDVKLANMQEAIAQLTGQLAAANDAVTSANEFHLLRTSSERRADIAAATQRVVEIQQQLAKVKKMYADGQVIQQNLKTRLQGM